MWTKKDQYIFDKGNRFQMAMDLIETGMVSFEILSVLEEAEKWYKTFDSDLQEQFEVVEIVEELFRPFRNEKNEKHIERLITFSL